MSPPAARRLQTWSCKGVIWFTMGWNKSDASSPSIRALSTSANDALSPEAYRNTKSMSALGWN